MYGLNKVLIKFSKGFNKVLFETVDIERLSFPSSDKSPGPRILASRPRGGGGLGPWRMWGAAPQGANASAVLSVIIQGNHVYGIELLVAVVEEVAMSVPAV